MKRYVVFRRATLILAWYVEAEDEADAIERVWPADPASDPRWDGTAGMEDHDVEAWIGEGATMWARRVRRWPTRMGLHHRFPADPDTEEGVGGDEGDHHGQH